MAHEVSIIINAEDRERLTAVVGDRNRPLKQVQRARIVLLSAERLPVLEIARKAGVSRPFLIAYKNGRTDPYRVFDTADWFSARYICSFLSMRACLRRQQGLQLKRSA